ncbi:MAG: hypothetical protein PHD81_03425 [Candidatus Nanoarchaeia archaeon]|nr:hypothetical protein [Candidatus Nanoarchaeia archaeon]MDD5588135.1 hypothetical protein [Candidatus Nanoarchaeia archaeon]
MKPHYSGKQPKKKRKDKGDAVILAIFFSFFTWIYTYREDKGKFWLGFALDLIFWWTFIVPIGVTIWAIIDTAIKDKEWYEQYYS